MRFVGGTWHLRTFLKHRRTIKGKAKMDIEIQRSIKEKISEIEGKSADGDFIYRGEPEHYDIVSSSLYRENADLHEFDLDYNLVENHILEIAKRHVGHIHRETHRMSSPLRKVDTTEGMDFELLTEIQHYGGKTNLIDFTADYYIALFFACDEHRDKPGRIIQLHAEVASILINHPWHPRHRVIAQKSVFVRDSGGYIIPHESQITNIPAHLKQPFLEHLRKYHSISTETIYNDIYGFIRSQDIHWKAYKELMVGYSHQEKGMNASNLEEKRREFEIAIGHYDVAIQLNPELQMAHHNRGEALLHIKEWTKAKASLIIAREMGANIIESFHNDYNSVEDFKSINGFELPADIAAMLTPR